MLPADLPRVVRVRGEAPLGMRVRVEVQGRGRGRVGNASSRPHSGLQTDCYY